MHEPTRRGAAFTYTDVSLQTSSCLFYKANSAFHPSWVVKWVPASTGKAKAGMVHSVSGWTQDVQVLDWFYVTGLIPWTLGPFNVFLLSGWICLHGVLD